MKILKKWQQIEANEVRYKGYYLEDARYAVVSFGSAGRVALTAVRAARAEGIPVGLLRPITVSPFPAETLFELSQRVESLLVVEMNSGQMLDDVLRIVGARIPVEFFGRLGGVMPFPDEILDEIQRLAAGKLAIDRRPRDRWLNLMQERI